MTLVQFTDLNDCAVYFNPDNIICVQCATSGQVSIGTMTGPVIVKEDIGSVFLQLANTGKR